MQKTEYALCFTFNLIFISLHMYARKQAYISIAGHKPAPKLRVLVVLLRLFNYDFIGQQLNGLRRLHFETLLKMW